MTFHSVFVNLRRNCTLDCCTITYLNEINDNSPIAFNAFNVYRRELAPSTVSLTGDRAQGDDSKHWAYSSG